MCVVACQEEAISCPGLATIDIDRCIECRECLDFCPNDALKYRKPKQVFKLEIALFSEEKHEKKSG